jgi:peptidoglycan/LPS O-acetylase OafA/YrhL
MKSWNPQYKTLDHWRGIAALWVMIFHGFGTTYEKSLHPFVIALLAKYRDNLYRRNLSLV